MHRRIMIAELKRYWLKNASQCDEGMTSLIDWARKMHDLEAVTALATEEERGTWREPTDVGMKLRCKVTVTA
jgi:hypothetical protein